MLSPSPLHPGPQFHVHFFVLETQHVAGDENASLLSQRKPKLSGYNGMIPVFAFRRLWFHLTKCLLADVIWSCPQEPL